MQYFNFKRLINKYKSEFTIVTTSDGYWNDSGDWVKGDSVSTTLSGAIINQTESKVYRSEGTLTQKDKQLFMLEPIDDKLHGAKVVYDGNTYTLSDCNENSKFTGVYSYTLKHISAFDDLEV